MVSRTVLEANVLLEMARTLTPLQRQIVLQALDVRRAAVFA